MRLTECYIENFGKISGERHLFRDGMNCILGDNGSGKTTLSVFIKVMLYGMGDKRKQSIEENDRKHYLPWNAGVCGGSLSFESEGGHYRIERTFGTKASDDTFTLYNVKTGKPCDDFKDPVGEELFGIDAEGFERTVFLSERNMTPKSDNKSVSAKLADLVGCDGDIGVMDEAMKALEERRKYYYKKGGGGAIADAAEALSAANERLLALERNEEEIALISDRLSNLYGEKEKRQSEIKELSRAKESAILSAVGESNEQRHSKMKSEVAALEAKRETILSFFKGNVPSFSEIDSVSAKDQESKRLINSDDCEDVDYKRLSEYFDGKTSDEEVEKVKESLIRVTKSAQRGLDPDVKSFHSAFSKRIPPEEEIAALIKDVREPIRASFFSKLMLWIGVAFTVIGGVAGIFMPVLLVLCGVGILLTVISPTAMSLSRKKEVKRRSESVRCFLSSIGDRDAECEEALETLIELRGLLARRESLEIISSDDDERAIYDFCSKFEDENGAFFEQAERIIARYERYSSLLLKEKYKREENEKKLSRSLSLRNEVESFLAGFETKTSDPISEIRAALHEYTRLTGEIVAKRSEMTTFALEHSIGEKKTEKEGPRVEEIEKNLFSAQSSSDELSRSIALLERERDRLAEELEARDELLINAEELTTLLAERREAYDTVMLTKKYLSAAKDNMTARYLGKTKERFARYVSAINGESDDTFDMDTSFGISKLEGGRAREAEGYSRGTRDLYNLASRLALSDSLYEGQTPFLIFDDPFTSFDDDKLAAAKRLLSSIAKEKQIIYFTCSEARSVK